MIDLSWGQVTAYASSFNWTFAAAGAALALLGIAAFWLRQWQAGIAFLAGAAFCLWIGSLITERDAARKLAKEAQEETAKADEARAECLSKIAGWQKVVAEQNTAVEKIRADAARRRAVALQEASKREAEAEARGREAGALAALSARPAADGDETCAAADREIVRRLGP